MSVKIQLEPANGGFLGLFSGTAASTHCFRMEVRSERERPALVFPRTSSPKKEKRGILKALKSAQRQWSTATARHAMRRTVAQMEEFHNEVFLDVITAMGVSSRQA